MGIKITDSKLSFKIKYSDLSDSDYIASIKKHTKATPDFDDVFVENDKNATPKEVLDAYTKAFLGKSKRPKSIFNSELGKKWQQNPENTDGDNKFKMPSNEHISLGCGKGNIFAYEDGYYRRKTGDLYDTKKVELDRLKKANGKIEDFKQGYTQDCWVLSGIKAISKLNNGAEIKKCMKKNPDGSWTVTFRGVDGKPQFTVTPEEFSAKENLYLSSGDPDVKILEIATRKLINAGLTERKDIRANQTRPLDYGYDYEMFKYLLDKDEFETYSFMSEAFPESTETDGYKYTTPNKIKELFNILGQSKIKYPMTIGTTENSKFSFMRNGKLSKKLSQNHGYSVDILEKSESVKTKSKGGSFITNPEGNISLFDPDPKRGQKEKVVITIQEFLENTKFFSIVLPANEQDIKMTSGKSVSASGREKPKS